MSFVVPAAGTRTYGPTVAQQKDMNGGKVVTFVIPKGLPPGQYRVTGYWGGNVAVEREFQVSK